MTNSEVYESAKRYSGRRARPGHATQKAYWVGELRLRIAVVNHQIIMNRGNHGNGTNSPLLAEAYLELRTGYEQAVKHVVGE